MQKKIIVISAAVLLVSVLFLFLENTESFDHSVQTVSETELDLISQDKIEVIETDKSVELIAETDLIAKIPKASFITTQFYSVDDFHAFVNENLEAAVNGDAEAQYFISEALRECKGWSKHPDFKDDDTFEQSMYEDKNYLTSNNQRQGMRSHYKLCKGFVGEDIPELYGDSIDWLRKSKKSKYAAAVVEFANLSLLDLEYPGSFLNTNDKTKQKHGLSIEESTALRKEFLDSSLKILDLKEPEALLNMSNSLIQFPDYNYEISAVSWVLLACKNGLPCDINSRFLKNICMWEDCQDSATVEQIFATLYSPSTIVASQELIKKIESAIDSEDWGALSPRVRKIK